jgi:hypothetical protein
VIRRGGVLKLDRFEPWILTRRLIKMSVNADEFLHRSAVLDKLVVLLCPSRILGCESPSKRRIARNGIAARSERAPNPTILAKYRQGDWVFAIYEGFELQAIYRMKPAGLEPYFSKWETKWHESGGKDINNPKKPVKFVVKRGAVLYRKSE